MGSRSPVRSSLEHMSHGISTRKVSSSLSLAALEAVLAICQRPLQPAGLQSPGWRALPQEGRLCPRDRPVCHVREAPTRDGLSEDVRWGGRPALQQASGPSVKGAPGEAAAPRSLCCTANRLSDPAPLLRSGTPLGEGGVFTVGTFETTYHGSLECPRRPSCPHRPGSGHTSRG